MDRRSGSNDDVYGARVAANGTVDDPAGFAIAAAGTNERAPAVTKGEGGTWGVGYERDHPGGTSTLLRTVAPK